MRNDPSDVFFFLIGLCVIFGFWLATECVFSYLYSLLLRKVPKEFRAMEPGMAWLLLIPLFNMVWIFFVVLRTVDSYKKYFESKGNTEEGDCGYGVGLAYCITQACFIVPCFNYLAVPTALVLLIIYLVKMFDLRGRIPETEVATP